MREANEVTRNAVVIQIYMKLKLPATKETERLAVILSYEETAAGIMWRESSTEVNDVQRGIISVHGITSVRSDAGGGDDVRVVATSISKTSLADVVLECDVGVLVPIISMLSQSVSLEGGRVREFDVAALSSTHLTIRSESLFT